jgi:hypothetical protein
LITVDDRGGVKGLSSGLSSSATATRRREESDQVRSSVQAFFTAYHAARYVACQGVLSHPLPVALVGECSIPVV